GDKRSGPALGDFFPRVLASVRRKQPCRYLSCRLREYPVCPPLVHRNQTTNSTEYQERTVSVAKTGAFGSLTRPRDLMPRQYSSGMQPIVMMTNWLPIKTSKGPNA